MRVGLIGRIVIGGLVIAAFFLVQLFLTTRSLDTIRDRTRHEQRTEESIVAGIRIEQLVIDLSSGTRGYVLTRNPAFLGSWQRARRLLPLESGRLRELAPGPAAAAIDRAWRSYANGYAVPLVRTARTQPAKAKARVATLEGLRRINHVRGLIDPFVNDQNRDVTAD